jgi:hypothetical protein
MACIMSYHFYLISMSIDKPIYVFIYTIETEAAQFTHRIKQKAFQQNYLLHTIYYEKVSIKTANYKTISDHKNEETPSSFGVV